MKKIISIVVLAFILTNNIVAQQFVYTETTLKNVVIEEFTGRTCQACPIGHMLTNELMKSFPERVFTVNIHEAFSPDTYPNLKTNDGATLYSALSGSGIPNALANRNTDFGVGSGLWSKEVSTLTNQEAPCNIAGQVVVDETTRTATITVEIYYTKDSDVDVNYLTIAMLQDSIWGSQINGESNPDQYVDGNYCHMHTLRDVITSTWGNEISPTNKGTLLTKTYTYEIPEIIGEPNGVDVNIKHLEFLAFVTNTMSGNKSRPILNVCRLPLLLCTQEDVFPQFESVKMKDNIICSNNKTFVIDMMNRGLEDLTSIKMQMEVNSGDLFEYEWNGNIASYCVGKIEFNMDIPLGTHDIDFNVVEANGIAFNCSETITTTCDEWNTIFVNNENDEIILELAQDKFGDETTWEIINDNKEIVASGGPYEYIFGETTTELHQISLQLPLNQCLKFIIKDASGNGMCCEYGEGYYRIKDNCENIVIEGNGAFGSEASHLFSIEIGDNINETKQEICHIHPNPANDFVTIKTHNNIGNLITISDISGRTLIIEEVTADDIQINIADLTKGMYIIKVGDKSEKLIIRD